MDIRKYRRARELEAELSPLMDIANSLDLKREYPEVFHGGHFEFIGENRTSVVPKALNDEILPIIIKYRDKLKKEFEEL